ncbi:MAG: DUF4286 family protein [Saprospiraceae bacterium]
MLLYNITTKIDRNRAEEWLKWLRETHLPAVTQTGLLADYKICRLLGLDDPNDETFAVQYFFKDVATFNEYQHQHLLELERDGQERFKDCAGSFRTVMEVFK